MIIEDNMALIQRFIDDVMETGNSAAITDFCIEGSMFAAGLVGQKKQEDTLS